MLLEYDIDTAMEVAREEAWEEGLEKGLEEGLEKGLEKGARNALALGLTVDMVQKITGLDTRTIQELANR